MFETSVHVLVTVLGIYAAVGVVFAAAFVTVGVGHVDSSARSVPLTFRLIIFPGTAALWPLLLSRWLRGIQEPPLERTSHR